VQAKYAGVGSRSSSDVLAGFDGEKLVVIFVYQHRRVFTCSSNPIENVSTSEDLLFFGRPVEITSRVHPHHACDPAVFTETYINVGHTTVLKVKDGADDPDRFMLLFPMSMGGNDEHDRGPFIAVHRIRSLADGTRLGTSSEDSLASEHPSEHSLDGNLDHNHESILRAWSIQALDLLHSAYSLIEPAIVPLGDPNTAHCQLVMNVRDRSKTEGGTIPMTSRWRHEASVTVGTSEDYDNGTGWTTSAAEHHMFRCSSPGGGFSVTNLSDPLLTEGATTGVLRLSRTGQVLYAGITDKYFRKGLALYERTGTAKYKQMKVVTDKTVMTPILVELGVGYEGQVGTWVGLLYERGGHPREYPLAGVVFQATEVVFQRHFIADCTSR
jgi:hypothetical protein